MSDKEQEKQEKEYVMIPISDTLRRRINIIKATENFKSYEQTLKALCDKFEFNGFVREVDIDEDKRED